LTWLFAGIEKNGFAVRRPQAPLPRSIFFSTLYWRICHGLCIRKRTWIPRKGEKVKSNAQVAARVKRIAEGLNREVATVAQAREMLGLPPKPKA